MDWKRCDYHYYASSCAEWQTEIDLPKLIRRMKKSGFQFLVWLVPGKLDIAYKISGYAPQVEGAIVIYESKEELCQPGIGEQLTEENNQK